ncbi:aminomethyl-transferring glycine dehydrogenase [Janibacter melonis]|uniref:aminomethyl-transferring glycine dehydrogenase n=1 Tax=Janibacter melonis TaxID=262209 RepID=UPI00174CF445|nr:aminomethyl-transferring glycine dehydrogenase [Janibacter melonis]
MSFSIDQFTSRHIGITDEDQRSMLSALGYASLDDLIEAAVPPKVRSTTALTVPDAAPETTVLSELRRLSERNDPGEAMIGLGYHGTITPGVIRRNVLESPAWYTAYTPYQPEISQGRLEALLNFQTVIADLSGLALANASLLDEATAVAEAATVMRRSDKAGTARLVVDSEVLPQSVAVLRTRCEAVGVEVVQADLSLGLPAEDFFGVVLQYPGASGVIRDYSSLVEQVHHRGAQVTVAADLLALTLLRPPGEWGADIVVGSSQRFGVPLGYGGPSAGYMAVREGLERSLPGRLVGVSVDAAGRPAYRLALQTREQHIRRDKATSNICTAQVLLAVMASMYAVYHGPEGLQQIARRVRRAALVVARGLQGAGVELVHDCFFDTVTARVPRRSGEIVAKAAARGVHLRQVDEDHVGISCSETTTEAHLQVVLEAFSADTSSGSAITLAPARAESEDAFALPWSLARTSAFLTHPVFHEHRSETSMLRYLRSLADKDYALDRGMIPLGSCTMKLNATTEMEPISLPGFANLHPFAPAGAAQGYVELIEQLEQWLADVTGYAKVSIQPNAGSQGEFAGLLAIRAYHRSQGQGQRDICLIPASAHGTNAASAVMAGMKVIVVKSLQDGTVDLADLQDKCESHAERLAAVMVTYPSTHGVYEEGITALCDLVHRHGGQVYVDGANLNALLGVAAPGQFGGDVSHLNLHKTFCIPHGGGGPGVGPVAVRSHLAPFLPSHPLHPDPQRRDGVGPVSAAPFGSAGILPISWAYVRLMGAAGLTQATKVAVLSANYVATRLAPHYPTLYAGDHDLVAHECILDLRPLTRASGVTVDDVAKRLIDFGFHAPTMSFPVAGTLMVEPTESENLAELDRFIDAMVTIKAEADRVASGEQDLLDSPLRAAPHIARELVEDWQRSYDRQQAVYPSGSFENKYWPPVNRIDNSHGDRNLVCSCPPPDAFASSSV